MGYCFQNWDRKILPMTSYSMYDYKFVRSHLQSSKSEEGGIASGIHGLLAPI